MKGMYGAEYAEALIHDAFSVSATNSRGFDKLLMISKRLIAIVILRNERTAFITTYEKILSLLDKDFVQQIAGDFERWGQQASNDYFCAALPANFEWTM